MKYGTPATLLWALHSDWRGYCILLGQLLVLQGKIKCLPPSPTPSLAVRTFYEPASTTRFKRAFTNLSENILLVDAQSTDFYSPFLFWKVLTCLKLDSFQACSTFLWKPGVVEKPSVHSPQPIVQYESNNILFKSSNFVYLWLRGFHLFFYFINFCFHLRTQGSVHNICTTKCYIILYREQTMQKHTCLSSYSLEAFA